MTDKELRDKLAIRWDCDTCHMELSARDNFKAGWDAARANEPINWERQANAALRRVQELGQERDKLRTECADYKEQLNWSLRKEEQLKAQLFGQVNRNQELQTERDELLQQLERQTEIVAQLRAEVERLNVQLAGCSVAALGNTHDSKNQRANQGDYGWSASYKDVCDAVDREISLRDERDRLKRMVDVMRNALEFYNRLDWKQNTEQWQQPAKQALAEYRKEMEKK